MAGRNPLTYGEIFNLSDKSVVNQILKDLKAIDKQYNDLVKSIDTQSKLAKESFVRVAEQVMQASQQITGATAAQRDALKVLGAEVDNLKTRQKNQKETEETFTKSKQYAADSVNGLKKQIVDLINEYNTLSKSDTTQVTRMKEISVQVVTLTKQQKALSDQLKAQKTVVDYATGSYKALEEETKRLMKELKELPKGLDATNKEAQELTRRINDNNTKLKEFDKTLNIHTRNVGNYRDALSDIGGVLGALDQKTGGAISGVKNFTVALAAAYLGFQSLQQAGEKIIQANVEISDSLSDVRRTASLTREEGDALVESLKKIDTRTSLKGLVDLATIGGQLGVAKGELVGFVTAIDQLTVSLSGEIAGGAEEMAKALGKVNAVFQISSKEGVDTEQAMLKTGSAILKLGQAGLATGDFLADFAQRVGGVAANAKISLPQTLAYGAALEEMGIGAEVAGTSMSQLINLMAKTPDKFFKIASLADANLSLKDFVNLVNTDAAGALNLFFKGLNAGGGTLTQFSGLVGELGLKGARSINVVSALAKNTELLETRTRQANDAFRDGTLATEQFQIKNTNLASALEKLKNAFVNNFVDSEFSQNVATLINNMVLGKTAGDKLTDTFVEQRSQLERLDSTLPALLARYDELTKKAAALGGTNKLTKEEQAELNAVMNDVGKIMPTAITQFDEYGNVVGIARDQISSMTEAMRENLKLANQTAAQKLREENAIRAKTIELLQKEIETKKIGRTVEEANTLGVGLVVKPLENQQRIAEESLKQAAAVKQLRDVLQQDLSPTEKKVYDQYYANTKKTTDAIKGQGLTAEETAALKKAADEADAKAAEKAARAAARHKTEIEKLEQQVRKLENTIRSQALSGKVNQNTLDELTLASERLKKAQQDGQAAIDSAVDPYKKLQTEVSQLTDKLQRQIAAGEDSTDTQAKLKVATQAMQAVQDGVKQAIAGTVGEQERLNAQLEVTRKEIDRQAAAGDINNATLSTFAKLTKQVKENAENLQLALLQVTDPMGALNLQAEKLKKVLLEQALAGDVSTEQLQKYKEILTQIAQAQAKLNEATSFNPLDPAGNIKSADRALQQNQRQLNRIGPAAEGGNRGAISEQRKLEQDRLQLSLNRINAEQAATVAGSKEWEDLETQKTQIMADQERKRNQISKEAWQYRSELFSSGFDLLGSAVNGFYDMQKERIQQEAAQLEDAKDKELAAAGNNTAAREAIEQKYARKQAELKRKQAAADKQQALFQVAIQTATGAARAVAESPLTFGMPWLAFVLAQGVLQAALIAAKPLPQYYKGTLNAEGGPSIVGELGSELIVGRDGTMRMTGRGAHVEVLDKGDRVYTANSPETQLYKNLIENYEAKKDLSNVYVTASGDIVDAQVQYDNYLMAAALDRFGKVVVANAQQASRDSGKVVQAITAGSEKIVKTIKDSGTGRHRRNFSDTDGFKEYFNKNMLR